MSEASKLCVDCGKTAPPTETNYTLISRQHGWRLLRVQLPAGGYQVEWRCAECWRVHKSTSKGSSTG